MGITENISKYLEMTGQSERELYAGEQFFGIEFILQDLVPKALKQKKKIVWKDEPGKGLGYMSYSLQPL